MAAENFKLAANQGLPRAMTAYGICCYEGYGVEKNYKEAIECFQKASELGDLKAFYYLGHSCYHGQGQPIDYPKAFEYFQIGADKGALQSIFYLGECFRYGRGKTRNDEQAALLYKKAADQGLFLAKLHYFGCSYHFGLVKRKSTTGLFFSEEGRVNFQLIDRVSSICSVSMALYQTDLIEIFPLNSRPPVKLYKQQVDQTGDAMAAYQLGVCYEEVLSIFLWGEK